MFSDFSPTLYELNKVSELIITYSVEMFRIDLEETSCTLCHSAFGHVLKLIALKSSTCILCVCVYIFIYYSFVTCMPFNSPFGPGWRTLSNVAILTLHVWVLVKMIVASAKAMRRGRRH